MMQAGLANLLQTTAAITALVGTNIYPVTLPVDAPMPALQYSTVAHTSSPGFATDGMQKIRIQFDAWATQYSSALAIRAAVENALLGYSGVLSDGTKVHNCLRISSTDFFQHEALQYRCMLEVYFLATYP